MSDDSGYAEALPTAATSDLDDDTLAAPDEPPVGKASLPAVDSDDVVTLSSALYTGSDLPAPPSKRRSIKDRFEDAKRQQQRAEVERMGKIRNETALSNGPGKVAGKWNSALANSRDNEANRFQAKRRETISQWQTAEAVGIVEKRVKQFEELYMQLAASIDKMEATIRAVKKNTKKWKKKTAEDTLKSGKDTGKNSTEFDPTEGMKIRCGQTATFWVDPFYFTSIIPLLAANGNQPVSLPTGVYSGESSSPHLEVVAVAILDSNSGEPYLAVTVDYSEGYVGDPSAHGRKKIAIFAPVFNEMVEVFSDVFFVIDREDKEITEFENDEEVNNSSLSTDLDANSNLIQPLAADVMDANSTIIQPLAADIVDDLQNETGDSATSLVDGNTSKERVDNSTENISTENEPAAVKDGENINEYSEVRHDSEHVHEHDRSADNNGSEANMDTSGADSNLPEIAGLENIHLSDARTESGNNESDSEKLSKTDLLIKESKASRETAREALLLASGEGNVINDDSNSHLESQISPNSLNEQKSGRAVHFDSPGGNSDSLGSASFDENDESFEGEGLSPLSTKNRLKSKAEVKIFLNAYFYEWYY